MDYKVEQFINEIRNDSSDEISKIIAGMISIIEGNEVSYEKMKNQKWFERIWYGLTGKNKATVNEMRAKRDELTKYTVQILVKMNGMINEHSECILDLYRAVAIIRRDTNVLVDEMKVITQKLNEKIISIDNYYFIINEIRNKKFDFDHPLISLIDILSMIDLRTAKDKKKMRQLKETMEELGFDFAKKVDATSFADEVLSINEESVGRILLFCKRFADNSRFLSYAANLIEGYFYIWDSERRLVRESGENIREALEHSRLDQKSECIVGEIYKDLDNSIEDSFDLSETDESDYNSIDIEQEYIPVCDKKINVIVAGMTGSGKSTLTNAVMGWNVALTGIGKVITSKTSKYTSEDGNINIYDTVGHDLDHADYDDIISNLKEILQNNNKYVLWYCVNALSSRYNEDLMKEIYTLNIPIIIVMTYSIEDDDSFEKNIKRINSEMGMSNIPIIPVLAKEYVNEKKNIVIHPFGLDDLITKTTELLNS